MKLYYSPASPYARKCVVLADELGLLKKIQVVTAAVNPTQPNAELSKENPLSKIPCLVLDDGSSLFDSTVICDYLDSIGGNKMIPAGAKRWPVKRREALANGCLDAGLLVRYETFMRPEDKRWPDWIKGQSAKVNQALDEFEREAGGYGDTVDLGTIAVASALGWLEFRKPVGDMRASRPKLFAWYDKFRLRPSMVATDPK